MGEATHIEMNLTTAHERFSEKDHHKLFDGAYFTAKELEAFRGVTASCGIRINDLVGDGKYDVILDDGTVEHRTWITK